MTNDKPQSPIEIELSLTPASEIDAPLVAAAVFEEDETFSGAVQALDQAVGGALSRARAAGDFRGKEDDQALLYREGPGGPVRVLFIGAGKRAKADREAVRSFAGRAVRRAESLSVPELHVVAPELPDGAGGPEGAVQAAAEGLVLAAWDFRELRTGGDGDDPLPPLVRSASVGLDGEGGDADLAGAVRTGTAFARGQNLARTLQARPGNVATPSHLAGVAEGLSETHGLRAWILGPEEMAAERMGALLAVARGSDQEPRLIVLEHRGGAEGEPPLALVGKGLTFDSGGISIKPSQGMEDMKFDMSGGAAVLGAMQAIADLGLPVNVVGVVPSSENLLNGSATKPGDVIRTRAGKTVEVINTDAEGRLILADALSFVLDHYHPSAVVDCATLTGACVVALGHHASAVLGTDDALVEELRRAGERAGQRCWPLPLWEPYRKQLDSEVADLKNVGGRPAGTITAAWFLSHFVGEVGWAHLDIAGTAYGEPRAPYERKGGFGVPTRLLLEWVRSRAR